MKAPICWVHSMHYEVYWHFGWDNPAPPLPLLQRNWEIYNLLSMESWEHPVGRVLQRTIELLHFPSTMQWNTSNLFRDRGIQILKQRLHIRNVCILMTLRFTLHGRKKYLEAFISRHSHCLAGWEIVVQKVEFLMACDCCNPPNQAKTGYLYFHNTLPGAMGLPWNSTTISVISRSN